MSCHARRFTEQTQAPMISVTHYQDRDGTTLGGLAPRRYACLSCHVTQTEARLLVENRFQDMDALTEPERQSGERGSR
jgi:cytochrome c-type protein NapB